MNLENKTIGFLFMEDFYLKEPLLYEFNKMSKIKNVKIITILKNNALKLTDRDIKRIGKITKNKEFYYNNDEINRYLIKSIDILILICCGSEIIYKLINNIFDNSLLLFIKTYEETQKPIIIGINSNNKAFCNLKNIEQLHVRDNYYFIPIIFPNQISKPDLVTFDSSLIIKTIEAALDNIQIKPLINIIYI